TPPPPCSPLFPYTTLFRSLLALAHAAVTQGVPVIALCPRGGPLRALDGAAPAITVLAGASVQPRDVEAVLSGLPGRVLLLADDRSEEHTSELQSRENLVCR